MVQYKQLFIDDLMLDKKNPRLLSVSSQSEVIEAIIKLNHAYFKKMMLSIKKNGIDPGDNLYIIDHENGEDFVVLEGNRRLAAMKVLLSPDVLDPIDISASVKKSLLKAATGFNRDTVEPIRCVKFDDREDANSWIYRRHTGGGRWRGPNNLGAS